MRQTLLTIIAILTGWQLLHAQQQTRLAGDWEFLRSDLGGIWEAVRPVKKGNPEEVPLWSAVQLPHCYNATDAVDPAINYYQGPAWYRTWLQLLDPYHGGRTLLHFEGVGQKAAVYIYTTKVGEHTGGYDEWTVDITNAAAAFRKTAVCREHFGGKVPLSIRVDNSRDLEMIPSDLSDFNLYGGIYRHLNLVYTPPLSIEKVFATVDVDAMGKQGRVNISTRCYNPTQVSSAQLSFKLLDPLGKLIKQVDTTLGTIPPVINFSPFTLRNPVMWSTSQPLLYTLEVSITANGNTCTQKEKIGFRKAEFIKKGPFMLNGKRLLLQGTHRHEDHAGVGQAMTDSMMRTEMLMMKSMGVNFIRLGHYQQSRYILQLCDSLGILVWEEIPWCRGGLGGATYQEQAKRMLTNMIEQHYNHTSVIIWGLGNENDWPGDFPTFDTLAIRAFMQSLNALSHRLDPSRKTAIRRCEFCKDIVDVYSPSIWAGWYRGIYTEYKEISKAAFETVDHFLHVEWGGDSHAGRFSENPDKALQQVGRAGAADERAGDASLFGGAARVSKDGDWSESYICNLIDWHLKEQLTMPWLTGTAQWPFKDFSTPVRPDNPVPYVNQKGVVERDFTKKEAFYVFQSYWTTSPMVHIAGHGQPVRWGNAGELKMIKVYSNCEAAELFVNNKSAGIKRRLPSDFPAAGLRWEIPMNTGTYSVKVIARQGKMRVEDTVRFNYQAGVWNKPSRLVLEKVSEEKGIITLQVKLLDDQQLQCMDAANWIRFGITGDGRLIENQGTATGSAYLQLYNGRAIIRVHQSKGNSVVSATIAGLPVALLHL